MAYADIYAAATDSDVQFVVNSIIGDLMKAT